MCLFRMFSTHNKNVVKVSSLFLLIKKINIVNVPDMSASVDWKTDVQIAMKFNKDC